MISFSVTYADRDPCFRRDMRTGRCLETWVSANMQPIGPTLQFTKEQLEANRKAVEASQAVSQKDFLERNPSGTPTMTGVVVSGGGPSCESVLFINACRMIDPKITIRYGGQVLDNIMKMKMSLLLYNNCAMRRGAVPWGIPKNSEKFINCLYNARLNCKSTGSSKSNEAIIKSCLAFTSRDI